MPSDPRSDSVPEAENDAETEPKPNSPPEPAPNSPTEPALSESLRVSDESGESAIRISPALGCNLYSWQAEGREFFFIPEGFLQHPESDPSAAHLAGGNPVLFPAVGRTWDMSATPPAAEVYRLAGRTETFRMPVHGLAGLMQWERLESAPDAAAPARAAPARAASGGAAAAGAASPTAAAAYRGRIPEAVQAENYPFDVELSLRYELSRDSVGITATARNHSAAAAPFAFGLHPYFRVSEKAAVALELPCTNRVKLHEELLVPTGEREPLEDPVLRFDDGSTYDIAFGDVNGSAARIRNVADGLDVRIDIDPAVEMFVVYSGAHTPFICVEPWTRGLGGYSSLRENATPSNPALGFIEAGVTRTLSIRYSAVHTTQRHGGTRS